MNTLNALLAIRGSQRWSLTWLLTGLISAVLPFSLRAQIDLRVTEITQTGSIVDIQNAGDGSQRLFLVDKVGQIRVLTANGTLLNTAFLNITDRVQSRGNEQGLLSMAFAPDYASSGIFYVYYTEDSRASVLSRFQVSADPDVANVASEERLLVIPQPGSNHNGGRLAFGPDGFLYWSLGDGGGSNDQFNQGQDRSTLLAGILRIDVSQPGGYRVPADNPFVADPDAADELWTFGLRNPWRISFDRQTGDLYIADVGQDAIEEINVQPADSAGGENYGWPLFEGGSGGNPALTFPVWTYPHQGRACSVTGGEVYRGPDYPGLFGQYIYGDFCSRQIWGLSETNGNWSNQLLIDTGTLGNIQTFGQDERGNIYVAATEGDEATRIYLLSDGPPATFDQFCEGFPPAPDAFEPNNGAQSAALLMPFTTPTAVLNFDSDGDEDWFRFPGSVATPGSVSFSVELNPPDQPPSADVLMTSQAPWRGPGLHLQFFRGSPGALTEIVPPDGSAGAFPSAEQGCVQPMENQVFRFLEAGDVYVRVSQCRNQALDVNNNQLDDAEEFCIPPMPVYGLRIAPVEGPAVGFLAGNITDASGGDPLEAEVQGLNVSFMTQTDAGSGEYSVAIEPASDLRAQVSATDYFPLTVDFDLSANQTTRCDVQLLSIADSQRIFSSGFEITPPPTPAQPGVSGDCSISP